MSNFGPFGLVIWGRSRTPGRVVTTSEGHVAIKIEVEEGAPVLVRSVTVVGVAKLPEAVRTRTVEKISRNLNRIRGANIDALEAAG